MSIKVNLNAMPSHLLDGGLQREAIWIDRSSSEFKMAPWDFTPVGEAVMLQLTYYRNPRVLLSEKALRLTYRHARKNKSPFTCFLLGTLVVDEDEQAVTITLDRLDPGREKPGSGRRVPNSSLPGDVVVPCSLEARPVSFSAKAVAARCAEDLSTSVKILKQCCTGKETMEVSDLLRLRCWLSCVENSDSLVFGLHWAGVTLATTLKASPIKAIPVIPTALARNLTSLCSLTQPIGTMGQKRGYLTMDQTRKLLLILESDPKVYTLPLVGVWLCGVTHIHSPQVWAWCLRFLHSSAFQERAFSDGGGFLVVLYSLTHRQPEFYMCQPAGRDGLDLDCQLLTSEEPITLYKNVEPNENKVFLFELSAGSQNQESELYKELLSRSAFNRYLTGTPAVGTPKSKLSISDHDSGLEEEDLSPRPSPNPHPAGEQGRQLLPTMPELSLVMDGSFVAGATRPPDGAPAVLCPTVQRRESPSPGSHRPHAALSVSGQSRFGLSPPVSTRGSPGIPDRGLEGTMERLGSPHTHLSPPPKTGMRPPDSLVEASGRQHPMGEFPVGSTPRAPCQGERPDQPPHGRPPGPTSVHPVPTPLPTVPSPLLKSASGGCCHCHHTDVCPSFQSQPRPDTASPFSMSHHMTPPKATAVPHQPKATPPRGFCMSPPGHVGCLGPSCVAVGCTNSATDCHPAPRVTPPRACCRSSPHRCAQGPVCVATASPAHGAWQCASQTSSHLGAPLSQAQGLEGPLSCMPAPDTLSNLQMNMPVDAYKLLMDQDRQLKLLQAQINKLLEAQGQRSCTPPSDCSVPQPAEKPVMHSTQQAQTSPNPKKRTSVSIAIGTGASLFCGAGEAEEWWRGVSSKTPSSRGNSSSSSSSSSQSRRSSLSTKSPTPNAVSIGETLEEKRNVDEQQHDASQQMSPHGSDSVESLMLGESASMICRRQSISADKPQSVSVTDDQKFFQDLLGQVNSRLQDTSSSPCREVDSESSSSSASSPRLPAPSPRPPLPSQPSRPRETVYNATVKQLEKLGVTLAPKDTARSTHVTVESASTLARINPEAVIPRLGVCDLTSGSLWAAGGSADLSMEANSIALKYLNDTQLAALSTKGRVKQTRTDAARVPPSGTFLSEGLADRTATGLSIFSPSNMSLATQKYMKRYGLIEGVHDSGEEEEDDEHTANDAHHHTAVSRRDSVSGLSVHMERSGSKDDTQTVLKNITNTPPPHHPPPPPHAESKGQVFRDIRSTVQGLLHRHEQLEKAPPKGNVAQKVPLASENQPPKGSEGAQGSVGNFLDLSRLRQLPKLF